MKMKTFGHISFVLLLLCCCCCLTVVNGKCWVECLLSQRNLLEPVCLLKDDGASAYCTKNIMNSDLLGQSHSAYKQVTISVKLSTRVVRLSIHNRIGAKLKVGTSVYNYEITQLDIKGDSAFIRPDFFYLLPNLKSLTLSSVNFQYFPHLSKSNRFLTYLYISNFAIRSGANDTSSIRKGRLSDFLQLKDLSLLPSKFMHLTDQSFSGLTALTSLHLQRFRTPKPAATFSPLVKLNELSYISSELTDISFLKQTPSLSRLRQLEFYDNRITSIQSNTFSHYINLKILQLNNNHISRIDNDGFKGLSRLIEIYLYSNQLRELNPTPFKGLESLTWIDLERNSISRLSSRMFESLPNLNAIKLYGLPLHCECNLQWVLRVNLNIYDSICATPPQHSGKPATDPSIYVNCTQELSYQCFNRSNSCPTGSYCQDTLDSYTCVCEEENHYFVKPLNKCVNNDQLINPQLQCVIPTSLAQLHPTPNYSIYPTSTNSISST